MEEVRLRIHEHQTIALPSRGSAGYRWHFTIDDPALVSVERVVDMAAANPLPGHSLNEEFLLTGLKAGSTDIRFEQKRSFGPAQPPLAARDVRVVIEAR